MNARSEKPSWFPQVLAEFSRWKGQGLVVAVSGGADSVGLLRLLDSLRGELGLTLSVAHLDHGVRGQAARDDAQFVQALAAQLALPVDLGTWRPEHMADFEAQARRARYDWLISVAQARRARAVAVAHTLDDQAETILHRIVRGTGPRGLAGMAGCRKLSEGLTLVRPLLGVRRAQIRDYLQSIGQTWREDASNADRRRTRARIRLELLPELASSFNPRVVEALVRLARLSEEEHRTLETLSARVARRVDVGDEDGTRILNLEKLEKWPILVRTEVLRKIWRTWGYSEQKMSAWHWRKLGILSGRKGREKRRRLSLPGGLMAERVGQRLEFRGSDRIAEVRDIQEVALAIPGSMPWNGGLLSVSEDLPGWDECIDADALHPFGAPDSPFLQVRPPKPGDRFAPLGLKGHSMPLADFLRGRKLPRSERCRVPVVCDREGIVWVAGQRIAERMRRMGEEGKMLRLKWEANQEVQESQETWGK